MAELPSWTEVSSDWMNVWGEKEDISIKNEDFDVPSSSNINFDIDTEIINASNIGHSKIPTSGNDNFIDICTGLDLGIDPAPHVNVGNEELIQESFNSAEESSESNQVKLMSEHELATEYLLNSSNFLKGNTRSNSYVMPDISSDMFSDSVTSLDVDNKIEINPTDFTQSQILNSQDDLKTRLHFVKYVNRDGKHLKIWECGVCSKEFGHQYTLMRHLPTHTDERKFICNTCGKAFRQMSTLSQHRAIHSADRPYVCELCRKTFNRVSTLISHRKTHSGLKPHQCHLCNKAFHQKGNLRNHIFTHTNERPYKCDVCEKGFNQMSNLMCHKLKAHQRNDKPKYICRICNKEFPKRIALKNHEEYKHGIKNTQSDSIPTANNGIPIPVPIDPNTSNIQSRVIQGDNGEKLHIIHIPDLPSNAPVPTSTSSTNTRVRYTNGVLVDAINTGAMRQALQANENGGSSAAPFALLRPIGGIPVLVRVLSAPNGKHMLVPATAEDLRAHGKITFTESGVLENNSESNSSQINPASTTVQIKIPVVAKVVQKMEQDGTVSMSVESPGPDNKQMIQDSINNTVENEKNMQFMKESCESMAASTMIESSSQQNFMNFQVTNYENSNNNNYPEMIDLESLAPVTSTNIQMANIPQTSKRENISYTNNNVQLDSFEILDQQKSESSNYASGIILEDQNLYHGVNNLTLYSESSNEYTIL